MPELPDVTVYIEALDSRIRGATLEHIEHRRAGGEEGRLAVGSETNRKLRCCPATSEPTANRHSLNANPAPNDQIPTAAARSASVAFIFITVMLDMLSIGIIIPVLPMLIESFAGDTARAAAIIGVFGTAWALAQFICSPVLGSLSDRFGRRPVILLSNFGLGLDYVLMAVAPNLHWLFVGRVISGITAGSLGAASAYIADITPPELRAKRFGLLGVAFGLGFVLGPALGGILGEIDARLPFWTAAALSLANALYGLFVLPESLPPEKRSPFHWHRANPLGSLRLLRSKPQLATLASISFLSQLAHVVLPSTAVLYMSYRFGWSARDVGIMLALVGICSAVVQGALIGRIVSAIGEPRTLLAGLACGALGFAIYGAARFGWQFALGAPVMALWGLVTPAAQGLMTRRVAATEQGQLQGANSSLAGLAALIGPLVFSQVFAHAIGGTLGFASPGAAFFLAAALLVLAMLLAGPVLRSPPSS